MTPIEKGTTLARWFPDVSILRPFTVQRSLPQLLREGQQMQPDNTIITFPARYFPLPTLETAFLIAAVRLSLVGVSTTVVDVKIPYVSKPPATFTHQEVNRFLGNLVILTEKPILSGGRENIVRGDGVLELSRVRYDPRPYLDSMLEPNRRMLMYFGLQSIASPKKRESALRRQAKRVPSGIRSRIERGLEGAVTAWSNRIQEILDRMDSRCKPNNIRCRWHLYDVTSLLTGRSASNYYGDLLREFAYSSPDGRDFRIWIEDLVDVDSHNTPTLTSFNLKLATACYRLLTEEHGQRGFIGLTGPYLPTPLLRRKVLGIVGEEISAAISRMDPSRVVIPSVEIFLTLVEEIESNTASLNPAFIDKNWPLLRGLLY